jgi:hypothetical protein
MYNATHPCTKLQNGEIHSFNDAMQTLIEQQEFEMDYGIASAIKHDPQNVEKEHELKRQAMEQIRSQVKQATEIYDHIVGPAIKQAAAEMRATGDQQLEAIADAIESNDYSGLSI